MSSKYKFRDQEKLYFVTSTIVDWVDLFIRNEYREVLLDQIKYNQNNKGLEVYAWCFMTSHIHMIIGTTGEKMEVILQGLKSITSRKLREAITNNTQECRREWLLEKFNRAGSLNKHNGGFQFWQEGNHPIELSNNDILNQKLDYRIMYIVHKWFYMA